MYEFELALSVSYLISTSTIRVTAFLETWKCRGIRLRSVKSRENAPNSGNLCSRGNLIVADQQTAGNQTEVWTVHEL